MDPTELMRSKGVMGNSNIIERIVQVEDKEKMKEFEDKLEKEKEEIRKKADEEKQKIEKQANLQKEEKDKLLNKIREREDAEEKAKTKQ